MVLAFGRAACAHRDQLLTGGLTGHRTHSLVRSEREKLDLARPAHNRAIRPFRRRYGRAWSLRRARCVADALSSRRVTPIRQASREEYAPPPEAAAGSPYTVRFDTSNRPNRSYRRDRWRARARW